MSLIGAFMFLIKGLLSFVEDSMVRLQQLLFLRLVVMSKAENTSFLTVKPRLDEHTTGFSHMGI